MTSVAPRRATERVRDRLQVQGSAISFPRPAECQEQTAKSQGPIADSQHHLRHSGVPVRLTRSELACETIGKAMARAEMVACWPRDDRCFPFLDRLEDAYASCTPKGRCRIGWIVANAGPNCWDIWLDVHTGEGRLRRRTE